ncbi:MAG: glycosyltransferase family 4 protein [Rhodopirellula sp.]|nr:glycosyltransferase family 4 protein [Rhodopirellula sp.]
MTKAPLLDLPVGDASLSAPPEITPEILRVLHVINGEHYSGAERVQDLLAGTLPDFGFEVGFASIKPGRFSEVRQSSQAALYEIPMHGRFDLRPVRRLASIVRQGGYRLLHAHTPRSLLVASLASRLAAVPLVYHVHSPTSRDSTRRWHNRLNALAERGCFPRASRLIAVSQSLGRHLQQLGVSSDRITVVPNGVPCRQPRGTRSGTSDPWVLGTVALFRPRKGIEVLLEALALLRQDGWRVTLRAVGDFETEAYRREIEQVMERLDLGDAVTWTGFTRDIGSELVQMDLFVLPSLFGEGLPMVVLEAMAAGVPVVATRVEGVPEVIRDGRDGLLAEPGDAHDLARRMAHIISGAADWSELRRAALDRQAEGFSDRSMAEAVAEVYREILEPSPLSSHGSGAPVSRQVLGS